MPASADAASASPCPGFVALAPLEGLVNCAPTSGDQGGGGIAPAGTPSSGRRSAVVHCGSSGERHRSEGWSTSLSAVAAPRARSATRSLKSRPSSNDGNSRRVSSSFRRRSLRNTRRLRSCARCPPPRPHADLRIHKENTLSRLVTDMTTGQPGNLCSAASRLAHPFSWIIASDLCGAHDSRTAALMCEFRTRRLKPISLFAFR